MLQTLLLGFYLIESSQLDGQRHLVGNDTQRVHFGGRERVAFLRVNRQRTDQLVVSIKTDGQQG